MQQLSECSTAVRGCYREAEKRRVTAVARTNGCTALVSNALMQRDVYTSSGHFGGQTASLSQGKHVTIAELTLPRLLHHFSAALVQPPRYPTPGKGQLCV